MPQDQQALLAETLSPKLLTKNPESYCCAWLAQDQQAEDADASSLFAAEQEAALQEQLLDAEQGWDAAERNVQVQYFSATVQPRLLGATTHRMLIKDHSCVLHGEGSEFRAWTGGIHRNRVLCQEALALRSSGKAGAKTLNLQP